MSLAKYDDVTLIAELESRTKKALAASDLDINPFLSWQEKARIASENLLSAQMRVGARP